MAVKLKDYIVKKYVPNRQLNNFPLLRHGSHADQQKHTHGYNSTVSFSITYPGAVKFATGKGVVVASAELPPIGFNTLTLLQATLPSKFSRARAASAGMLQGI